MQLLLSSGLFLLLSLVVSGQSNTLTFEAQGSRGFAVPHRNGVENLITKSSTAFSLSCWKAGNTNARYNRSYWRGWAGSVTEIGGDAFGLAVDFGFITEVPIKRINKLQLSGRLYGGLAYITNPWDRLENHQQIMIGSHLNFAAFFGIQAHRQIAENIALLGSLGLKHYSNGAAMLPNLGVNIPQVSVGMRFAGLPHYTSPAAAVIPTSWKYRISVASFTKQASVLGPWYFTGSVITEAAKPIGAAAFLAFGIDAFYNPAIIETLEIASPNYERNGLDAFQLGGIMSYQLGIGKSLLSLGTGIYAVNADVTLPSIYNRLALRYHVSPWLFTQFSLKSHLAKADFFEVGVGIEWP